MDWIINNWYVLLGIISFLIIVGVSIYKFVGLPTKEQIRKVKEWLLLAVIEAEKELGSGTGKVKLRYVFGLFVDKFPVVAKVIKFDTFSNWVDEALKEMRILLETNVAIKDLVEGK